MQMTNLKMKCHILLTLVAACYSLEGVIVPETVDPLSDDMIVLLNSIQSTWKAGRNFPKGTTLADIKVLCGTLKSNYSLPLKRVALNQEIPEEFDSRKKWPNCRTIKEVRDQADCGSCWAFGAVEAMSDRICVHSGGKVQAHISAEDLLSCCDSCGGGCEGGDPGAAWQYFQDTGIVTGGQYGTKQGCRPYTLPHCDHHVTGKYPKCKAPEEPTPKCYHMCEKGYSKSYNDDKFYGKSVYSIGNDVKQIQTEIMTNGPVTAAFNVYADFPLYKSGVYAQKSEKYLGGHAIKILGWGVEKSVPYWLVANSWNPDWGAKGFFKIRRGTNECGIEEDVFAGIPKTE